MAIHSRRWTRQPQSRVDLSSDCRNSVVWCPGINPHGDVRGGNPGQNVSASADSIGAGGRSVYVSAVSGRWETAAGAGLSLGTSEDKSFLVYLDLFANRTSYDYVLSLGNTTWAVSVRHFSVGSRAAVYDGIAIHDSGVFLGLGQHAILACHNTSAQTLKIYINGVQTATVGSVVGASITPSQKLVIGNIGSTNANAPSAHYYLAAVIGGDLSYRGVELTTNPWSIFKPRRIWVPQAAIAGPPTLSLPTYVPGSLTATGFRPRVTAS